jgi:hypothetical protein
MRSIATRLLLVATHGVLVFGCVTLETEQRVERGPQLRTYEREVPLGVAGVAGTVQAKWPDLGLRFFRTDSCRTEAVSVFREDVIVETRDPNASWMLAAGATQMAWGGILFASRGLFDDEPSCSDVNGQTECGWSNQKLVTNISYLLVGLGIPAVVAGVIGLTREGETRTQRQVEEVAPKDTHPCQLSPLDGTVEIAGHTLPEPFTAPTRNSALTLTEQTARTLVLNSMLLDGTVVALDDDSRRTLEAYAACLDVLPVDEAKLGALRTPELVIALTQARECASLEGTPGNEAVKAIEAQLARTAAAQ